MAKDDGAFRQALEGKKIPVLTLDNNWHRLFTQVEHTPEIQAVEEQLNELIKRQGKANTESKEIVRLKRKLLDEIMTLADRIDSRNSRKYEKEMSEHQRLVGECNDKLNGYRQEIAELPDEIEKVNERLMLITMRECYERLQRNTAEIDEIDAWITEIRKELKKKTVRKKEKENMNFQLYSYMHDLFGADVMELFDLKYDPEERHRMQQEAETDKDITEDS
jgi:Rad3-related DNA helicase